ncbi:MAG: hypothetical protein FJZ01_00290 [Candidatus Sericytochromatia bacterium]|nr:hypothetical protein [Candidatus Tanganyikabacteria bacterium]
MRRIGLALGAVTVAASLAGCGMSPANGLGTNAFKGLGFTTKSSDAEWTIMLHLAASNNLESFAYINLNEAEAGINSDKVNFIVLFDGNKKGDSKIMKVVRDPKGMNTTLVSPTIDDNGAVVPKDTKEIDSGDYRTVQKFVQWTAANYPAKKFAYVSWDHGSGIFAPNGQRINLGPGVDRMALKRQMRASNQPISSQGFAWDDETGNHVTTAQFTDILKAAPKPFEMTGMDACLMAHVEMAYQMQGYGKNLVASEELEPGLGWDYNEWLSALSANPSADGAAHGAMIVKGFHKSYTPGGAHYGGRQQDVTLSNLSYDAVKNDLTPALNNLSDQLLAQMATDKAAIKAARSGSVEFYNSDCADLGSFVAKIESVASLKGAAKAVRDAYGKAVTAEAHAGSGVEGASGGVVYFPESKWSWKKDYDDASKIAFAGEKWRTFLAEFIK